MHQLMAGRRAADGGLLHQRRRGGRGHQCADRAGAGRARRRHRRRLRRPGDRFLADVLPDQCAGRFCGHGPPRRRIAAGQSGAAAPTRSSTSSFRWNWSAEPRTATLTGTLSTFCWPGPSVRRLHTYTVECMTATDTSVTATDNPVSAADLARRTLRRTDYVSCNTAFIDCRMPGSTLKENYSIIGSGVTQNPDQVINLEEPHGFNIGAAAMPNGVNNNLHLHFTAEVFLNFRGRLAAPLGRRRRERTRFPPGRHRHGADLDLPRVHQHRRRRRLAVHCARLRQHRRHRLGPDDHAGRQGARALPVGRQSADRHARPAAWSTPTPI